MYLRSGNEGGGGLGGDRDGSKKGISSVIVSIDLMLHWNIVERGNGGGGQRGWGGGERWMSRPRKLKRNPFLIGAPVGVGWSGEGYGVGAKD